MSQTTAILVVVFTGLLGSLLAAFIGWKIMARWSGIKSGRAKREETAEWLQDFFPEEEP